MVLSFSYISSLIIAFGKQEQVDGQNLEVIDQFLERQNFITHEISTFNDFESKAVQKVPAGDVEVRGDNYKVDEEQAQLALTVSRLIKIDYKECLKIASISGIKNDVIELSIAVLEERDAILQCVLALVSNTEVTEFGKSFRANYAQKKNMNYKDLITLLKSLMKNFNLIEKVENKNTSSKKIDYAEVLSIKNKYDLACITIILRLLTILSLNSEISSESSIIWFQTLEALHTFCFENLKLKHNAPVYIYNTIDSFVTLNTILLLGLNCSDSSINGHSPYYNEAAAFKKINEILQSTKCNPIIYYMWSFVLYSKKVLWEEDKEQAKNFITSSVFPGQTLDTVITHFVKLVESEHTFSFLKILSETISLNKFYAAIICSFLTLALNFIPLTVETSQIIAEILTRSPREYAEAFFASDSFENKLSILTAKLPLLEESLVPLLHLSTVNADFANYVWSELNTYMVKIKLSELDYDLTDDYTNTDVIVLKKEALVTPPLELKKNVRVPIAEGTKAKILIPNVADEKSLIVFLFKYSGWSLLGRVLFIASKIYSEVGYEIDSVSKSIITLTIEIATTLLNSDFQKDEIEKTLKLLSQHIPNNDIVSFILKLFDLALQNRSSTIISVCSKFLCALFAYSPESVWAYLGSSKLLDRYGKTGYATTILGSNEIPSGEYDFTISLAKLAYTMTSNTGLYLVNSNGRAKKAILEKLTLHLLRVYESCQYWKYAIFTQRFELCYYCTKFFNKVTENVYGVGVKPGTQNITTTWMTASGELITSTFLSSHSPDVYSAKVLTSLMLFPQQLDTKVFANAFISDIYTKTLNISFKYAKTLILARSVSQRPLSTLEIIIFQTSSELVELYATNFYLKNNILSLFSILIQAPCLQESPFLLSYLGEKHSQMFFNSVLNDLEESLVNYELLEKLCRFFGTLVESKQDGLSIFFVTGSVVSSAGEKIKVSNKSILEVLKLKCEGIEKMPQVVACALLNSISLSINSWNSIKDTDVDKKFINQLMETLNKTLNKMPLENNNVKPMDGVSATRYQSNNYKIISKIVEILSLYLFSNSMQSDSIVAFLEKIDIASNVASFCKVEGYNKTIHETLNLDFESMYPKFKLLGFTYSPYFDNELFHYSTVSSFNIGLMDVAFKESPNWPQMRERLHKATESMELVTSKIFAAKAWGALLTNFVQKVKKPLDKNFVDLVNELITLDSEQSENLAILEDIFRERLELCFFTLYSFEKNLKKLDENTIITLFKQLLLVFKSNQISYLKNVGDSTRCEYYRPILRCALILLDMLEDKRHFTELISDQLLEFFEIAFSKGIHLIFSNLISELNRGTSKETFIKVENFDEKVQDTWLLLSLFTKIKRPESTSAFSAILASSLNNVGTLNIVLSLYANSHLFNINGEPILGSLSLSFISELCSIDAIAESFISNGLFTALLNSTLSQAIQSGNGDNIGMTNLNQIWSHDLLTILLQLLSKFGPKILPEACIFISFFSDRIQSTILCWSSNELKVSSALINETSQLLLLQNMLESFDYQTFLQSPKLRNLKSKSQTDESSLFVGLSSEEDKGQLSMAFKHLLSHPKYLNSRIVASSAEEQRILDNVSTRAKFVQDITKGIQELLSSLFTEL